MIKKNFGSAKEITSLQPRCPHFVRHKEHSEGKVGDQDGREEDQGAIVEGCPMEFDRVFHNGPGRPGVSTQQPSKAFKDNLPKLRCLLSLLAVYQAVQHILAMNDDHCN